MVAKGAAAGGAAVAAEGAGAAGTAQAAGGAGSVGAGAYAASQNGKTATTTPPPAASEFELPAEPGKFVGGLPVLFFASVAANAGGFFNP